MPVREFVRSDIPEVANLYWNHLGTRSGTPPSELHAAFADLYFSNPLSNGDSPSYVYRNSGGDLVGFIGMTTRKMWIFEEEIRVGVGGNFVVHPTARSGLAAPRLLSAVLNGSQDILLTDSANDLSRPVLERVGFTILPGLNIHWSRPLRPCQYATYLLSRRMKPAFGALLRAFAKPFCFALDSIPSPWKTIPKATDPLSSSELTSEALHQCLVEFGNGQVLRPDYDAASLRWLMDFMERNQKRGALQALLLRDETGKIAGWYIYYAKRGAVGEVVQVGGTREAFQNILAHLFLHARENGVVGLHGQVEFERIADYSDAGCIFSCRGGWVLAYSRRPELIKVLQSGHVSLTRLDGEWCLNPGE